MKTRFQSSCRYPGTVGSVLLAAAAAGAAALRAGAAALGAGAPGGGCWRWAGLVALTMLRR